MCVGATTRGSPRPTNIRDRVGRAWERDDLLVGAAPTDRKQAHSNARWLERYDAAALQRIDESGQVRKENSRQCVRRPTALASKLNDGRLPRRTHREQRSEISIGRHDDSPLDDCALEDHIIIGVLQSKRADMDRVMTSLVEESSKRWRKRVVDQEPHSPAARGSARSRTASAAKRSASRTSSASRSGYNARMPSVVCPSATMATTVATGIRRPRRHGTPPI